MTIILRKFALEYIPYSSLILIVGSPQSGKSTITKELLYKKNYPIGLVISHQPQNKINKTYDYIPPIFIHSKYDEQIIKKYIKTQKSNISDQILTQNSDFDTRSFIIFEEIFHDSELLQNKYIRRLFRRYRDMNILCIIEMEYLRKFTKSIQTNTDYIFILKDNIQINRRKIFDLCKDKLQIEFTLFCKLMDDYTDNFNFLIFDLKSPSNNIQDKLFWYKSSLLPNLRLCTDDAWIYNNKNYIQEIPQNNENYLQKIYQRQIFN
jgi:GTPase SAR1 family protein